MALQITETKGMFSVFGELNSANVNILNRHMSRFINPANPVILNLESVQAMDRTAAFVLQTMYQGAMRNNSVLSIIGLGNTSIRSVLNKTKTSYILNDDRI